MPTTRRNPPRIRAVAAVLLVGATATARPVEALHDGASDVATVTADEISFDARGRGVTLTGNVRVDAPPFHFRSDGVMVERTGRGLEIRGDGRVAFCPCAGTPLALHVTGATVAPPGDLLLESPTVEMYGTPVLWLPWFWLRAPSRVGVLPPLLAYRGADGLFIGGGVHMPWSSVPRPRAPWPVPETPPDRLATLRAGGYALGGARVEATYRTPGSFGRVAWDHLRESGVAIDARGRAGDKATGPRVAWDVDALLGRRALVATSDLGAASRPFDHGRAEAFTDVGGVTVASGVDFVSPRGVTPFQGWALGPALSLSRAGAVGEHVTYDAAFTGGTLAHGQGTAGASSVTFARGASRVESAFVAGPVSLSVAGRGILDGVAAAGEARTADLVNRAGDVRVRASVPVGRAHGVDRDPWLHRIEPEVALGAISVHEETALVLGPAFSRGASLRGSAVLAEAGLAQAIGRWGARQTIELDLRGGAIAGANQARPVLRGRGHAGLDALSLGVEAAHVAGGPRGIPGGEAGSVVLGRVRVGRRDGPSLGLRSALRGGADPILARALVDPATEPSSGYLATEGLSVGASAVYPWSRLVVTAAHVDHDVSNAELLFARGSLTLRDRCECLGLTASGGKRLGREGIDVWLTIQVGPERPR